jgi:hypothetical protein
VVAVVGPVMTWRTFMRLELAGSAQSAVDLSALFSRSGDRARVARTESPVWVLIKKEFRLQHATFVVSGLYVVVWLMTVADRAFGLHALTDSPMFVATFVNVVLVPLLCGAVASASERQFNVADWQMLLPMASWRQWTVKAGVALGMTYALAVALPILLASIGSETGWRNGMEPLTVMMICAAALYVSSLNTNPLRALLLTVPAIVIVAVYAVFLQKAIGVPMQPVLRSLARALPFVEVTRADFMWWIREGTQWLAGGFSVLLLAFGHANHRTPDRSWRRLARQVVWLSAYAVAAACFIGFLGWRYSEGAGR